MELGLTMGLLTVAVITACLAGKGCNDSDNAVWNTAVNHGCSVIRREHAGTSVVCNEQGRQVLMGLDQ
jgi:hypothetical protein